MDWLKNLVPWLFLLIAVVLPSTLEAKDVILSWDSSPTPTVVSYTLYWDNQNVVPFRNHVVSGDVLTFQIVNLPDDEDHYFAVTASDEVGHESVYSNIVKSDKIEATLPQLDITVEWQIIEGNE